MNKQIYRITALVLVLITLSGCAPVDSLLERLSAGNSDPTMPGKLVQSIDVTMTPWDPDFSRHYETIGNLNALLNLLREMETSDDPETEPFLSGGQTYYTVTTHYPNGDSQSYYIMGYRYLKTGDDPWCVISYDSAMAFSQFIREHPSDNVPGADSDPSLPPDKGAVPAV